MTAFQGVALIVVAIAGTAVVLARDPARQALVASVFGLCLAILFLAFQAPDVALSQIVVGAIALPAMIMLALRKVIRRDQAERGEG
jgi:energy-converting hydrogenase B subunit D